MTVSDLAYESAYFTVRFTLAGVEYSYTTAPKDLPGGFVSTPKMEIELPPNTGTLEDTAAKITLPLDDFTEMLTLGEPIDTVFVEIEEMLGDPSGASGAARIKHFVGTLAGEGVRNPGGRDGIVVLPAKLGKAQLDIPLGIPCGHQCPWTLFASPCPVDRTLHRFQVIVTDVSGYTMTVAAPAAKEDRYFKGGQAWLGNVAVRVRDWRSANPLVFHMNQRVPDSWVGESVTIYAGCDKLYSTCDRRFNAKRHHGGIGAGIPAYNPNFEDAPGE